MKQRSVLRVAGGAVVAALVATTVGCHSMARVPANYIAAERPAEVFVLDMEGSLFTLHNPTIVNDSLVGTSDEADPLALNLREVDAMVVRKASMGKTYGLVAGLTAVAGMVTYGVVKATTGEDCVRVANRNSQCVEDVPECKYSSCTMGNGF